MRYRRPRYRSALVLSAGAPRPLRLPDLAERPSVQLAQTCWRPAADVFETADAITVTVELAGVDEEQLDVLLFEDALVVEGQRRLPRTEGPGVYHAAEIREGPFRLEAVLPEAIDPERVGATYDRGLLRMTLGKRAGGDHDGS